MSVPLISRPRKISDAQFVGDLTSLFDRRGIKTGDSQSLEDFGSVLASNDALRSDLFTLCTAISHMAESDLSGEQLLGLVARALAGYKLLEDDDSVEIPESMRSAFLTGYEAWSNRGSQFNEPLPWPPARPAQRSESVVSPESPDSISEPAALKVAARGFRTVQEALDIARERTPFDTPAHRPMLAGKNIEGLTLDELKKLLEDIQHWVSRIEPPPNQQTSIARSPIDDFERRDGVHQSEDLHPSKTSAESETGVYASLDQLGSSVIPEPTEGPGVAISESAFLARHGYLKPPQRLWSTPFSTPVADVAPAPAPIAAAPQPVSQPAAQSTQVRYVPRFILRDSRGLRMVGGIAASALMMLIGYLGVVTYHDMHTENVYAYHELESSVQSTTSGQSSTLDSPSTPAPKDSANATRQPHPNSSLTDSPIYVRSSEMMGYALFAPRPVYPPDQGMRMGGTVVLQVTISEHGSVISTRTISGPVAMRSAAIRAVQAWRFKPYLVDGNPTQVSTIVELAASGK